MITACKHLKGCHKEEGEQLFGFKCDTKGLQHIKASCKNFP